MNAFRLSAWLRRLSYAWNGRKMTYLLIHAVWVLIAFVLLGLVQIAKGQTANIGPTLVNWSGAGTYVSYEITRVADLAVKMRVYGVSGGGSHGVSYGIQYRAPGYDDFMEWSGAGAFSVEHTTILTSAASGQVVNVTAGGTSVNLGAYDPPPPEQLFDKTMKNESGVPMKWAIYDGTTLIEEVIIQPGEVGRLSAVVNEDMDLTEQFFVQSEFSDGVWLALDDYSETPTVTKPVDVTQLPEGNTPPSTPPPPTPPPPGVPQGPSNSVTNINTGVWTATEDTTAAEALDKTTYRQGVDKITEAIGEGVLQITGEGGLGAGSTFDDEPGEEEVESIGGPWQNVNIAGKIPEPPEFFDGSLGSVSSVSANIPFPAPIGTWTFEADFSTHESSITLIRNVLRIGIHIGFFFLCVKTIRESSAS